MRVPFAAFTTAAMLTVAGCAIETGAVVGPPPPSEAAVDPFWDRLAPYGQWWWAGGYGWVYTPNVATGWRPYTLGHWATSPQGWTWVSDEPFGWAVYHYGRWLIVDGRWAWIPGDTWAPAWVTWYSGPGYVAWAPLGLADYPLSYVTVDRRAFLAPRVGRYAVPPQHQPRFSAAPRVYHHPPDVGSIERDGGRRAPVVRPHPEPRVYHHRR